MAYTLGEAAKATGISKTSIHRAIKSGRISATRNESGSYEIEPSELHRVYPPLRSRNSDELTVLEQSVTPKNSDGTGGLQVELAVLRERVAALATEREREREQLNRQIEDLRDRLDHSEQERRAKDQQLTALLTDQRKPTEPAAPPPPAPPEPKRGLRGWLHRLIG